MALWAVCGRNNLCAIVCLAADIFHRFAVGHRESWVWVTVACKHDNGTVVGVAANLFVAILDRKNLVAIALVGWNESRPIGCFAAHFLRVFALFVGHKVSWRAITGGNKDQAIEFAADLFFACGEW